MKKKKKSDDVSSQDTSIYSPLPLLELSVYCVVTVGVIIYITYCVFRASVDYDGVLNIYDFQPGWSILGREKDISNFEWHFWYEWFLSIYPWYVGHIVVGKVAECYFCQYRKLIVTTYSLLSLSYLMGWRVVCLIIGHCFVSFMSSLVQSQRIVWLVSLSLLTTLNFEPFISLMKRLVDDDEEESWYYLLIFTLAGANIRYTSFSLEKCRSMPSTDDEAEEGHLTRLVDMALYVFYFPLFFTGPLVTYDLFDKQFNSKLGWTKVRIVSCILNILRMIFWAAFNEFLLHYLYFNTMTQNSAVINSISLWTIAGMGYWQGQFFMNKYLVMFGLPSNLARIDNMDPPHGPKCISYIYLYSDMWKYFDPGLYSFLKRYIYIPLGGSRSGLLWHIVGSVCCFVYIYYWHGVQFYIFLWVLLNFIGVTLEGIGKYISKLPAINKFQMKTISPAAVRRLHAVVAVPVFLTSVFSIFCFFGGHVVSYIFFRRLIIEGWPMSWLILLFFLYCSIQTAMEVNRRQMMKKKTS